MKVKRAHYETNNSMAVTICLYSRDINFAKGLSPKLYEIIDNDNDLVNVLHALITIARNQEVTNGQQARSKQETIPQV